MSTTQPEELTGQVDGVTSTFNTTFHRRIGQSTVFYNGAQIGSDQYSEPNSQQIELGFVPPVGSKLHIIYETDQTVSGRVLGYPYDPTGGALPPPTDDLQAILDSLFAKDAEQDNRLDALEAGGVLKETHIDYFTATAGQTVFNLSFAPVDTLDVEGHLQGVVLQNGLHFTVAGNTVTWLNVITLIDGHKLQFKYDYVP